MPGQRAIAEALGMSQSSVTLALRGSPRISRETRERILEMADRMGYRANPMISTLMRHVRSGGPIPNRGRIAILAAAMPGNEWGDNKTWQLQYEGVLKRARLRGFKTKTFYLLEPEMSYERIDSILETQEFAGVIITAPEIIDKGILRLKWDLFASVTISYDWSYLPVDRVSTDHYYNASLAFREVQKHGFRRIGLVLPEEALNPHDRNWLAGYLGCASSLPREDRLPVFIGKIIQTPIEKFSAWYERWKPDALLCLTGEEIEWLRALGLSPYDDLPLVCLNRPKGSDFSGVDEDNVAIGEFASDVVIGHIYRNERGLPQMPQLILAKGIWKKNRAFRLLREQKTSL